MYHVSELAPTPRWAGWAFICLFGGCPWGKNINAPSFLGHTCRQVRQLSEYKGSHQAEKRRRESCEGRAAAAGQPRWSKDIWREVNTIYHSYRGRKWGAPLEEHGFVEFILVHLGDRVYGG